MFDEIEWLEGLGHEVAHFSTAHPDNVASPWSDYFVPYLELGPQGGLSAGDRVRAAYRMFENRVAAKNFERLLDDFEPDIIHAHGIHRQISPSILVPAERRGIPAVESLHDFHHICPADTLLYRGMMQCGPRQCGNLWYGGCVRHRCVRDSLPASMLSAAETSWQRMRRVYERGITRFISPSAFMAEQMRVAGWETPCDVIPNSVPVQPMREGVGEGFVLICRLAVGKGVHVALQAAIDAGVHVRVAGTGPLADELMAAFPTIEFLGFLGGDEVSNLVAGSRAVIVPSEWYENAPMSVLEPMAQGVPVIASRIGGIPEQVTDEVDGLLVEPGDVKELARAMRTLEDHPEEALRLGANARETIAGRFAPQEHLVALLRTYDRALGRESELDSAMPA
jgi:glycosyltransferase involved in cell wall biosynthesis